MSAKHPDKCIHLVLDKAQSRALRHLHRTRAAGRKRSLSDTVRHTVQRTSLGEMAIVPMSEHGQTLRIQLPGKTLRHLNQVARQRRTRVEDLVASCISAFSKPAEV